MPDGKESQISPVHSLAFFALAFFRVPITEKISGFSCCVNRESERGRIFGGNILNTSRENGRPPTSEELQLGLVS